jgi:hypothetical protein
VKHMSANFGNDNAGRSELRLSSLQHPVSCKHCRMSSVLFELWRPEIAVVTVVSPCCYVVTPVRLLGVRLSKFKSFLVRCLEPYALQGQALNQKFICFALFS